MKNLRLYLAEAIGTFGLIFVGAGAIVANQLTDGALGVTGIALAHGLILMVMIYATGHISGAHINPAVTLTMLVTGRIKLPNALGYILAQLGGATLAALLLSAILGGYGSAVEAVNLGTPALAGNVSLIQGILAEAVMTFFLVFVIFGTAVDKRAPKSIYGVAIGLTVAADILVGGALTGAAMNPARTFGPALVQGYWEGHIVYWVGPILGALLAGLLYHSVLLNEQSTDQPDK